MGRALLECQLLAVGWPKRGSAIPRPTVLLKHLFVAIKPT